MSVNYLEDLIEKHKEFWRGERRILKGFYKEGLHPTSIIAKRMKEGRINPEDIQIDHFYDIYYEMVKDRTEQINYEKGELIHSISPLNGFPWMEAIVGCEIYSSRTDGNIWVQKTEKPFDLLDGFNLKNNFWLEKLLDFYLFLDNNFSKEIPIGTPILRGPMDILQALIGNNLYFMFYDQPELMKDYLLVVAEIWKDVFYLLKENIPSFNKGYCNAGLWSPELLLIYQEDASGLISKEMYQEFVLPADKMVISGFNYSLFHLHSSGIHIAEIIKKELLDLKIVEVNIDPVFSDINNLVRIFNNVQKDKKLFIFFCEMDQKMQDYLIDKLKKEKLIIMLLE